MKRLSTVCVSLLGHGVSTLLCASSMAGNSIEDTHSFKLGFSAQDADITVEGQRDPFPPIEVDLTSDLGLDDNAKSAHLGYRWRFAEEWALSLDAQSVNLDGGSSVTKDFNFDGKEFTAGLELDNSVDIDIYRIDVTYSFIRNDKLEVRAGGGVHAFDFGLEIQGRAGITDGTDGIVRESTVGKTDVLAPLPNLRAGVTYLISPKWEVSGSTGWLSLTIDNIDGGYAYADIATAYRFTDRFGAGASYSVSKLDVEVDRSDGKDKLEIEFQGPSIYLTYGF